MIQQGVTTRIFIFKNNSNSSTSQYSGHSEIKQNPQPLSRKQLCKQRIYANL